MSEEEAGAAYDPRLCDETLRVVLCLLLALAAGERTVCGESGSAACVCDVQYQACLASERVTSTRGLAQGLSRLNHRGRLPAACWALCCERASAYIIAPASIRPAIACAHTRVTTPARDRSQSAAHCISASFGQRLPPYSPGFPIHHVVATAERLLELACSARAQGERRAPRRVWRGRGSGTAAHKLVLCVWCV